MSSAVATIVLDVRIKFASLSGETPADGEVTAAGGGIDMVVVVKLCGDRLCNSNF
jgi:anti-sigma-K factor RskA